MTAGSGAITEATCSFNLAAVAMDLNNIGQGLFDEVLGEKRKAEP